MGASWSLIREKRVNTKGRFFSLTLFLGVGKGRKIIIPQGSGQVAWKAFQEAIVALSPNQILQRNYDTKATEVPEMIEISAPQFPPNGRCWGAINKGKLANRLISQQGGETHKVVVDLDLGAFGEWVVLRTRFARSVKWLEFLELEGDLEVEDDLQMLTPGKKHRAISSGVPNIQVYMSQKVGHAAARVMRSLDGGEEVVGRNGLQQQAALVLNASRRFRYTLDLKKEDEKEQTRRKIRAHAQVIRAAYLFREAGERANGTTILPPTSSGDYAVGQDQLASMTRDHNFSALQQVGGASLSQTSFALI
ncbi:hypothetical protein HHK36_026104 [Tetracentron sinense]|uniref:Calcium-transporting P-type ATPase N-terminal autoinhibitory domain-containing protein n=1 Tax=Tetracentron sinense TaxID=13715 RepID=A0A834YIL6_TETSI|nr:hypothetical protein HHK36_026104 [Tetracentron sinense]